MHPLVFIRDYVLKCTTARFARIAGVHRMTAYRWFLEETQPTLDQLGRIRAHIRANHIPFDADWFFAIPPGFLQENDEDGRSGEDRVRSGEYHSGPV